MSRQSRIGQKVSEKKTRREKTTERNRQYAKIEAEKLSTKWSGDGPPEMFDGSSPLWKCSLCGTQNQHGWMESTGYSTTFSRLELQKECYHCRAPRPRRPINFALMSAREKKFARAWWQRLLQELDQTLVPSELPDGSLDTDWRPRSTPSSPRGTPGAPAPSRR